MTNKELIVELARKSAELEKQVKDNLHMIEYWKDKAEGCEGYFNDIRKAIGSSAHECNLASIIEDKLNAKK